MFSAAVACLVLFMSAGAYPYGEHEHPDIGSQAKALFLNMCNAEEWTGETAITDPRIWSHFIFWIVNEDFYAEPGDIFPSVSIVRTHFWDPDTDEGFWGLFENAKDRARRFWYGRVVPAYSAGNLPLVYVSLGRIAHLLADMSVPAHVHGETHMLGDFYEGSFSGHPEMHFPATADEVGKILAPRRLEDLFHDLAEIGDNFPCEWSDGELHDRDEFFVPCQNFQHWVLPLPGAMERLARAMYPQAIAHTVVLLKSFFSTFNPEVGSLEELEGSHSGLRDIAFTMGATGYGGRKVQRAELYFSTAEDSPNAWDPSQWLPATVKVLGEEDSPSISIVWPEAALRNLRLNTKVWIRGRVIDALSCNSEPKVFGSIYIDSRAPEIGNVKIKWLY